MRCGMKSREIRIIAFSGNVTNMVFGVTDCYGFGEIEDKPYFALREAFKFDPLTMMLHAKP